MHMHFIMQIQDYQLQLMKVKQNEEERGGGAANARRWNGLRTIVEARAMLKTVFRSASQHKAQVSNGKINLRFVGELVSYMFGSQEDSRELKRLNGGCRQVCNMKLPCKGHGQEAAEHLHNLI